MAVNLSYGESIRWNHFSQYFSLRAEMKEETDNDLVRIKQIERDLVEKALRESKTKTDAAKALGISRTMLYKKIRKYGL